ncbi:M23 family metallopeptidase [Plebeiibacterium sediminum]|uniref:M23 family metallopeptidase n=1 Tax=Plebeiibacterium sediminum TaxID=2992112 RepID=A0AAE3M4F1_9BACT|nr:M23 family metallopeptidase [Plebeiobacterium sediminum]MCW3787027.1 M23 family metallopeptidase [Plebeiobacterium sediminum]
MANNKYIYDPETLSYIPVENTLKSKLKKLVPYAIGGGLFGLGIYIVTAVFYFTPKEKLQAQQIKDMKSRQAIFIERLNEADKELDELAVLDDSLYRTMLGVIPLDSTQRMAGTGGSNSYEEMINSDIPSEIIDSYKMLDNLVAKMNVQKSSYSELFKEATINVNRLQHLPAIIPISNWDLKYIGSGFAPRRFHPILKRWRQHEGIDFIANVGTKIFAAADGVVSSARLSDSFGRVVEIDHGFGITTLYAHMSKFEVKQGQKVKRGEVVGYVGNTGLSAGPHLHYEVHVHGKEVDPVNYFFKDLTAQEYRAVVEKAQSVETCME